MLEHQKALTQLQTSIAKAQGDEAEAVALAEGARRDRDACVALHDVEHRSLLQVGNRPPMHTNTIINTSYLLIDPINIHHSTLPKFISSYTHHYFPTTTL